MVPQFELLESVPDVLETLRKWSGLPGCLLLHSALTRPPSEPAVRSPQGRYSFLMADPFGVIVEPVLAERPLGSIRRVLSEFQTQSVNELPPFQGGVAGLFSYDLNRSFETIPPAAHDEFQLPAIVVGAYDCVLAWDHWQQQAWLISQGFPETEAAARQTRAQQRLQFFKQRLSQPVPPTSWTDAVAAPRDRAPQYSTGHSRLQDLCSDFSEAGYLDAVARCVDYIHAGDAFQINLSQRLLHPATSSSLELYESLCRCNPATFSGYFDLSQISNSPTQVVSASPERLASVRERIVETRPIKGTRRRTGQPRVDLRERDRLMSSDKDRAENAMIVDLMRNDLSPVCEDDSIRVTQLCQLEQYQSVLHLVSAVEGTLRADQGLADLVRAIFPGGSVTGAPKIRAMEIIAELEPTARGAYCGSLGYLGFDGSADMNILIRTITASQGWWQIPVGGGIVSQSKPRNEFQETWTKAAGMLAAIGNS